MAGADRVLVTGGAGYIGAHACKALAEAGYLPVTYDNLCTGHDWAVKWGPFERGDVLDAAALSAVVQRHRPVAAMHFAALSLVGESVAQPDRYYATNILGSLNLLRAMRDGGVSHLVFSSTCAVYGEPAQVPIPEHHPPNPINPYGRTKLAVENLLSDMAAAGGPRYIALRYFNAAGAEPGAGIGERHAPETHLVPLAIQAAAGGAPLRVFGTDYPTPDGTAIRDYIHVSDIAAAHVIALRALLAGEGNACLNLGTGHGYSIRQVVAAIEEVTGRRVPLLQAPRRPGDPPALVADVSPRLRRLGWQPVQTLEQTLSSAWDWHHLKIS